MGEINIPDQDREAIKAVDLALLKNSIDQCIDAGHARALLPFRLSDCGAYVSNKLRSFETALHHHHTAKSLAKRARTEQDAARAGRDLQFAVQQMKDRLQRDEENEQRYFIDDCIPAPLYLEGRNLHVRIDYRWRQSPQDQWTFGHIEFRYAVDLSHDRVLTSAARKPSKAQQARDLEEKLYREWDHLKNKGLYALRDYFRAGNNGADIPSVFQVRPDPFTGHLNNHSANFWLAPSTEEP